MLLAGTKSGDTWMWLVPTTSCKTFAGHGVPSTVGEILHDGNYAASLCDCSYCDAFLLLELSVSVRYVYCDKMIF